MSALLAAWDAGIEWCECDIHLTADHKAVVIHDVSLDRTTTGTGLVREKPASTMMSYRLRDRNGRVTDESPPLLKEVLRGMPATSGLIIEIKESPAVGPLWAAVHSQIENHRVMIQSFNDQDLYDTHSWSREISTCWLVERPKDIVRSIESPWQSIHLEHTLLTREVVVQLRAKGKKIGAWTVNEASDVRRVFSLGVDLIITDDPIAVERILSRDTVEDA